MTRTRLRDGSLSYREGNEVEWIKSHERIDDLQVKGLGIIQNPKWFCFGIDAVLVSHFVEAKKESHIVDLGTGTGIIPLLLSARFESVRVTGLEIQAEVADMAWRSVMYNQLQDRIKIHQGDIKNIKALLKAECADVVVSNPPYFKHKSGILNQTDYKTISRHEVLMSLEDLMVAAYHCLKPGGAFYIIHRPDRMVDLVWTARLHRLEPKKMQLIQAYYDSKPNLMLVKCVKFGNPELTFEKPLVVYEKDGSYTQAIKTIYQEAQITVF